MQKDNDFNAVPTVYDLFYMCRRRLGAGGDLCRVYSEKVGGVCYVTDFVGSFPKQRGLFEVDYSSEVVYGKPDRNMTTTRGPCSAEYGAEG